MFVRMHVFYAPGVADALTLPEDESKHAVNVLRMKTGDALHVLDGEGRMFIASVADAHPKRVRLANVRAVDVTTSRRTVCLAVGVTRQADRLEWLVEKATELGVRRFVPLLTERTGRHKLNTERLRKIAIAAIKQSGNVYLPVVDEPVAFKLFLQQPSDAFKIICTATAHEAGIKNVVTDHANVTALVGPEGDFTDGELALAMQHGFTPVNLGPYRLRTETAAMAAACALALL